MNKTTSDLYPPYFEKYIALVGEDDLLKAFSVQQKIIDQYFFNLPPSKYDYAYADGKWTLKQVLQHIIDCERVFQYRALAAARADLEKLPGFDENMYAESASINDRLWEDLCTELQIVRKSTLSLFQSFNIEQLANHTNINGNKTSTSPLAFIIVGHLYHHIHVIEERYL